MRAGIRGVDVGSVYLAVAWGPELEGGLGGRQLMTLVHRKKTR